MLCLRGVFKGFKLLCTTKRKVFLIKPCCIISMAGLSKPHAKFVCNAIVIS